MPQLFNLEVQDKLSIQKVIKGLIGGQPVDIGQNE
jgi:hypothetical protein